MYVIPCKQFLIDHLIFIKSFNYMYVKKQKQMVYRKFVG